VAHRVLGGGLWWVSTYERKHDAGRNELPGRTRGEGEMKGRYGLERGAGRKDERLRVAGSCKRDGGKV